MRLLLAGTGSGCGKTTVSLALMRALAQRGLRVAPFKVGPDYIDPAFHAAACGRPSHNLDAHLLSREVICSLLGREERTADIAVIEGVMGYYDGMDSTTLQGSTWEMAGLTQTPVILIVDASGGAASVAATVLGFQTLRKDSRLCGVLVNRASSQHHFELVRDAVERYTGLPCVGWMPRSAVTLPSRHLGLVPAEETEALEEKLDALGAALAPTLNIDRLMAMAREAQPLPRTELRVPPKSGYRLGIAMDKAFSFYYAENLRLLEQCGMELCFFSPLGDEALPPRLNGLYLGGGFPEVFAEELNRNRLMRQAIRSALENGLTCYGECGGLLYLSRAIDGVDMTGFLPIQCQMTKRLQRFGYVTVTDETGARYPAHEFHHAVAEPEEALPCAFSVEKTSDPSRRWQCGFKRGNTLAGFPHLHFASDPELIGRLFP